MPQERREQVDGLLSQLEAVGSQQQPRPLDNPLLYGNYNVAYTSTSKAQGERGQRECAGCMELRQGWVPDALWHCHSESGSGAAAASMVEQVTFPPGGA